MNRWWSVAMCVPLIGLGYGSEQIHMSLLQNGDSLGVVLDWEFAPDQPGQLPIEGYNAIVVDDDTGDTLARSYVSHPTTIDTLPIERALRERVIYSALQSVDTAGVESETWTRSLTMSIPAETIPAPAPLPPASVEIDTTRRQIEPPDTLPPPSDFVFQSDWSTATGASDAALRDTDRAMPWTAATGVRNAAIVNAASLGVTNWPVANLFRVPSYGSGFAAQTIQHDLGAPSSGTHRYFRVYVQVPWADSHGGSSKGNWEHGMEMSEAEMGGGDGFVFVRIPQNDGTWWPVWGEIGDARGLRYIGWDLSFSKTETYRLEWHVAYGASTYTVEIRIYDEDGVLVATEDDYWRYLPSENTGMRLGDETWNYTPSDHRYFRVGTNGPTSNFPLANIRDDQPLFYYGAVAISETGWCGEYR